MAKVVIEKELPSYVSDPESVFKKSYYPFRTNTEYTTSDGSKVVLYTISGSKPDFPLEGYMDGSDEVQYWRKDGSRESYLFTAYDIKPPADWHGYRRTTAIDSRELVECFAEIDHAVACNRRATDTIELLEAKIEHLTRKLKKAKTKQLMSYADMQKFMLNKLGVKFDEDALVHLVDVIKHTRK